jgi:hypothetical protein
LIQLTRSLCRQLRVIVKRALGRMKPDVRVIAGPSGLRIQANGFHHAVEYFDPEPREPADLTIPTALLDDVQGNKSEPVRIYCPKKKVLAATWDEKGVERTIQYTLPKPEATKFHDEPASFTSNSPILLQALDDASRVTDQHSTRYALGCLHFQLGRVSATDGRQLLVQTGFDFGFQEELLAHSSDVFGCSELPQDQPVMIGKTDTHLVVRVGPWSLYAEIQKEARFPRVLDIIPAVQSAKTTLDLHSDDAAFLVGNASRLPSSLEEQAVTFECNGAISVRAKTAGTQAAELQLTNSSKSGEDVTICLNRGNLINAARMQFNKLYLYGNSSAVLAHDDYRSYLFMPLESQANAVKASNDCLKIPSPVSSRSSVSYPRPYTPSVTMPTNRIAQSVSGNTVQVPAATTSNTEQPVRRRRRRNTTGGTVLEQAIVLRDQLRSTLSTTKDLIRTLKIEHRSQKSLKLALDSLKSLQHAA